MRQESRLKLANKGLPAISPMMEKLRSSFDEYRIRLGIIYSLRTLFYQPEKIGKATEVRKSLAQEA